MSFGFPAYHQKEILHAFDLADAKGRARRAADALRWRFLKESDDGLVFRVDINWRSWGEEVKMSFYPEKVLLRSECRLITQCFDWGKNLRNCEKIAKAYEV